MRSPFFLVLLASLVWPSLAAAQDKPSEPPAPPPKTAYLSFSPLHLTRPIAELTGEMRLGPKTSLSVIMGAGTLSRQTYWNVGTQLLFYPWGDFERGIQLGLETSYASYAGGIPSNVLTGAVNAVSFSPVLGYKYTWSSGFTISSQAGFSYAPGAEIADRRYSALYNVNLGWSF